MKNIIIGTAFIIITLICAIISILQLKRKGVLLNNEYFYATEEERKKIDKKPHYIQSGVVFALLAATFLFFGLRFFLDIAWLYAAAVLFLLVTVVYAVISSVKLHK